MTKSDLVALGYGPSFSIDIIRQAKCLMVEKGYGYYQTKKLGRVPIEAVEEILGIHLTSEEIQTMRHTNATSLIKEG
jgi:hypothetical protein